MDMRGESGMRERKVRETKGTNKIASRRLSPLLISLSSPTTPQCNLLNPSRITHISASETESFSYLFEPCERTKERRDEARGRQVSSCFVRQSANERVEERNGRKRLTSMIFFISSSSLMSRNFSTRSPSMNPTEGALPLSVLKSRQLPSEIRERAKDESVLALE